MLRHAVVTVCVAEQPCATIRERELLRRRGLQYVALPSGARWADYDGTSVRVSVRTKRGSWHGAGTFDYTPPDGSPCSCGSLVAEVPLDAGS